MLERGMRLWFAIEWLATLCCISHILYCWHGDSHMLCGSICEFQTSDSSTIGLVVITYLCVINTCFTCNCFWSAWSWQARCSHLQYSSRLGAARQHKYCSSLVCKGWINLKHKILRLATTLRVSTLCLPDVVTCDQISQVLGQTWQKKGFEILC